MTGKSEIKDYYDHYYHEHEHCRRPLRSQGMRSLEAYETFLDFLRPLPERKILDVGCGTGLLLKTAEARGLETYGIDLSTEAVEISRRNSTGSEIKQGSGEDIEYPDQFFDYVACVGVLEHFPDIDRGLREMRRVARDDGRFMIVVPNRNYYMWKFRSVKGTEQREIGEKLYSFREWKEKLLVNGFKIIRVHRDIWRLNHRLQPKWIIKWFLRRMMPLKYTYQFVFILKKGVVV